MTQGPHQVIEFSEAHGRATTKQLLSWGVLTNWVMQWCQCNRGAHLPRVHQHTDSQNKKAALNKGFLPAHYW